MRVTREQGGLCQHLPGSQHFERLSHHEGYKSSNKWDVRESRILCCTRCCCHRWFLHTPCRQQPHGCCLFSSTPLPVDPVPVTKFVDLLPLPLLRARFNPNPCLSSRLDSAKIRQAPIRVSQSNMSGGQNRFTRNYSSSLFYFDRADSHGLLSSASALHYLLCFALFAMVQRRVESVEWDLARHPNHSTNLWGNGKGIVNRKWVPAKGDPPEGAAKKKHRLQHPPLDRVPAMIPRCS